jgi:hypothetical protein
VMQAGPELVKASEANIQAPTAHAHLCSGAVWEGHFPKGAADQDRVAENLSRLEILHWAAASICTFSQ